METRPGIKTTEFWFGIIAFLAGASMASGLIGEGNQVMQILGGICMTVNSSAYAIGRGLSKQGVKPS